MTAKYISNFDDTECKPVQVKIFSSRLLLAEKSSAADDGYSLDLKMESLAIRVTLVAPTLMEIRGYSHGGIND